VFEGLQKGLKEKITFKPVSEAVIDRALAI